MAKAREPWLNSAAAPAEKPLPELVFRNLLPTDALVALAREQDALYRGVVRVDAAPSRVTMHRLDAGRFRVSVTSQAGALAREGSAESGELTAAVRYAFTELLRDTVDQRTQPRAA
jgi:hypothetical protein